MPLNMVPSGSIRSSIPSPSPRPFPVKAYAAAAAAAAAAATSGNMLERASDDGGGSRHIRHSQSLAAS